jgi:phosphoserine phosphatase RsbU/P
MGYKLVIEVQGMPPRVVALTGARLSVGRSSAADLAFPEDGGLSRQQFALEAEGDVWVASDLGSKNGTCVNGVPLQSRLILKPGDRITAGRLSILFSPQEVQTDTQGAVVFAEDAGQKPLFATTAYTSLEASAWALRQSAEGQSESRDRSAIEALIAAGRTLSERRPLSELFPVLLDLAARAVNAQRGVLMTVESGGLALQSRKGEGFRISSLVRDKVLKERSSLLVRDAQAEGAFREQMSIVEQRVHSMMAVPLQTEDRAIGLIYVDSPLIQREFTKDDLNLLTVIANVAAVRIETARLEEIEAADRIVQRDLSQAAEIQRGVLPAGSPAVAGFEIAGYNAACRTVGGDYYEFFTYSGARAGLALGDVSGKGMPAALMMMALHARVCVLAEDPGDLGEFMTRLNKATCAHCPSNRFITFFFCVLDGASGELSYANAGHNPPVVVRGSGEVALLDGGGPVLGVLPIAPYREMRTGFFPGDLLAIYSDGVTEAVNAAGEEFGEERLIQTLKRHQNEPAAAIVDRVNADVAEFAAGAPQADDITLVIAKRS